MKRPVRFSTSFYEYIDYVCLLFFQVHRSFLSRCVCNTYTSMLYTRGIFFSPFAWIALINHRLRGYVLLLLLDGGDFLLFAVDCGGQPWLETSFGIFSMLIVAQCKCMLSKRVHLYSPLLLFSRNQTNANAQMTPSLHTDNVTVGRFVLYSLDTNNSSVGGQVGWCMRRHTLPCTRIRSIKQPTTKTMPSTEMSCNLFFLRCFYDVNLFICTPGNMKISCHVTGYFSIVRHHFFFPFYLLPSFE